MTISTRTARALALLQEGKRYNDTIRAMMVEFGLHHKTAATYVQRASRRRRDRIDPLQDCRGKRKKE